MIGLFIIIDILQSLENTIRLLQERKDREKIDIGISWVIIYAVIHYPLCSSLLQFIRNIY